MTMVPKFFERAAGSCQTAGRGDVDVRVCSGLGRGMQMDGRTVDEEERSLENRPSTQLLTRSGPQLATDSVGDQEDHLTDSGSLCRDTVLFRDTGDSVGLWRE